MHRFESLDARRLLAAGDTDPALGTGGRFDLPNQVDLLVPESGGSKVLLVGGDSVARRNAADFSLDMSFGNGGSAPLNLTPVFSRDAKVLPDGKILISGQRSVG